MMRRLAILLILALVVTVLALAPVAAGKPNCDIEPNHGSCKKDDTKPTFEPCVFDPVSGELEGWPENGEAYRCEWVLTPVEAAATYSFQIQSDRVETVKLPQLTVNAEPWTPSSICFNEWANRPQDVPFPPKDSSFWTFSPALSSWSPPADGAVTCAEGGPYLFAIRVNRVKGGDVKLVISPPGLLIDGS
jgi:hypothetical protein